VLKLATLDNEPNAAALVVELVLRGGCEGWASPAMLEEYRQVLGDEPAFLADVTSHLELCYPLLQLTTISHEPDNRFLECALAVGADFLITVNTKRGHFDRDNYGAVRVTTPGRFLNLPSVQPLLRRLGTLDGGAA
jgi:predicted nucleic acid-binding protein